MHQVTRKRYESELILEATQTPEIDTECLNDEKSIPKF